MEIEDSVKKVGEIPKLTLAKRVATYRLIVNWLSPSIFKYKPNSFNRRLVAQLDIRPENDYTGLRLV